MSVPTLHHNLTEAEVCRRNGWGVGTLLAGDEGYGPSVIRITAIGEDMILAREITRKGKPVRAWENNWTLSCRDWSEVAQ